MTMRAYSKHSAGFVQHVRPLAPGPAAKIDLLTPLHVFYARASQRGLRYGRESDR